MAKLSKIVKIKQEDYSTLLSEGQVTINGVTHVYDPDALYTVVDPAAPEYADSAGYAANAGTAQVAVKDTSGNNIVQTYDKKPLIIEVTDEDTSVQSGTYSSVTQAIAQNREVIFKVTRNIADCEIVYLTLAVDNSSENNAYYFTAMYNEILICAASLYSNDTFEFCTWDLVHRTGTETISGNKTFSGTTTFTGTTKLGSKATATTPAAGDNDTSVATTAFVKTAISGKQDALVSGTNIKTVNGNSLLGSGNLCIAINESNLVHKTGDENISGVKNFDETINAGRITICGEDVVRTSDLATKLDKLTSSTDNAVVRFDGTTGNIQNSGVIINDSNQVTAAKFITSGGTSSQFVKGDGSLDGRIYINTCSLPYWANIPTATRPIYTSEPEFKSVKINGISEDLCGEVARENAVIQYDTATKVVKFVFN